LALTWRRFSRSGAIAGMLCGLVSSFVLIALSPVAMGDRAIFPLENPGIVSIPIGLIAAIAGSLLFRDREAEQSFDQLQVRATTGLGAEV
jgi:cation/acetate symporter